jgi:hypothetical protein
MRENFDGALVCDGPLCIVTFRAAVQTKWGPT